MATLEQTLDKAIEVAVKRAILKAHPVGSLYLSLTNENPSVALGGGTWVKIGTGKCLWGADSSHAVGTEIAAGLPNITGSVGQTYSGTTVNGGWHNYNDCGGGGVGALYLSGKTYGSSCTWANYNDAGKIAFDASKSNSIYGASTTVQPPALAVNIWKRTA